LSWQQESVSLEEEFNCVICFELGKEKRKKKIHHVLVQPMNPQELSEVTL